MLFNVGHTIQQDLSDKGLSDPKKLASTVVELAMESNDTLRFVCGLYNCDLTDFAYLSPHLTEESNHCIYQYQSDRSFYDCCITVDSVDQRIAKIRYSFTAGQTSKTAEFAQALTDLLSRDIKFVDLDKGSSSFTAVISHTEKNRVVKIQIASFPGTVPFVSRLTIAH